MTRIYISGPMSGHDLEDIQERFGRAERMLSKQGRTIINPALISGYGFEWGTYMTIAYAILHKEKIDFMYMLKGWEQSNGCQIEHELAQEEGIKIIYEDWVG